MFSADLRGRKRGLRIAMATSSARSRALSLPCTTFCVGCAGFPTSRSGRRWRGTACLASRTALSSSPPAQLLRVVPVVEHSQISRPSHSTTTTTTTATPAASGPADSGTNGNQSRVAFRHSTHYGRSKIAAQGFSMYQDHTWRKSCQPRVLGQAIRAEFLPGRLQRTRFPTNY